MSKIDGVVIGIVTNVADPLKQNRVKIHYPWMGGANETDWVRVSTMMAGGSRGSMFMPEVNDECVVTYLHGDSRFPIVIGFLWNGRDLPPGSDVRERQIVSKNGHKIRFLDSTPASGNKGALIIEDAHGNVIALSNGLIYLKSTCVLALEGAAVVINGRVVAPNANPI